MFEVYDVSKIPIISAISYLQEVLGTGCPELRATDTHCSPQGRYTERMLEPGLDAAILWLRP